MRSDVVGHGSRGRWRRHSWLGPAVVALSVWAGRASVLRRCGAVVLAFGAALALSACAGQTTGTTNVTDVSATLHATGRCDSGQTCTWYWEYWPANQARATGKKTPVQGPVNGPTGNVNLSINITGLTPSTSYRWVFCGSPNNGGVYACAGPNGTFSSTTADPPPDYETFTTGPSKTLAEHWDGMGWTIQTTPNRTGGQNSALSGVSCTSATGCTAVGGALAERWDGTSWTIQTTPPGGSLSGVSCTSATACTAVGLSTNSADLVVTLAERWDGTAWTVQTTPNPPDSSPVLSGVSCTSPTACTAVGEYISGQTQATLAERWDGTAWTIQPTPNPNAGQSNFLSGVSCTSATACTAVGSSSGRTLAERWDGTAWTIQPTPNPTTGVSELSGVSCTSPTACTAVGDNTSNQTQVTLAERWDGTAWSIQPTPNPTGPQFSALSGVSCTSANACTAAGRGVSCSSGTTCPPAGLTKGVTLAELWDGTTWKIQPTPNPTGVPSLVAVSCSSATACTAVGEY
jgi:hypothetical protein